MSYPAKCESTLDKFLQTETQIFSLSKQYIYHVAMPITTSGYTHQFLQQMEYKTEENFKAFLWVSQLSVEQEKKSLSLYSRRSQQKEIGFF